jgi:riboflavin synthase
MFTGIVEETGAVLDVDETADGVRLRLGTTFDDLSVGQSISVSGVCLTVEAFGDHEASDRYVDVFLAAETRDRTYLGDLAVGDRVNLERAMPADGRFDGHLVQGHVDGTGEVVDLGPVGEDWRLTVEVPEELSKYVVEKGSICVDGVSLTVAAVDGDTVEIAIVPETYRVTTVSALEPGDPVHLEVDVIAKYVESMVA